MNNTSLYNTMLMEDGDNSWSNLKCDWSTFSFTYECSAKKNDITATIQKIKEKEADLLLSQECVDSNFKVELDNFKVKYHDVKTENYDILKKSEDIKGTRKEYKESCKKLESTCGKLSDIKNSLESEISKITSDHKLHKTSYKQALQKYQNNFDFNVVIVETSDDVFVANVTFKFSKDMEPIKVVVNRNQRKIIEIDSHGLMDTKHFEDTTFDPIFFCNLRQKVLDSIL